MNRRNIIKLISALPFAGTLFADNSKPAGRYDAVMKAFPEGTWVFGVGEHKGCSQTFNYEHPDSPQPFSYLDATNPAEFRPANAAEIHAALSTYR